MQAYYVTAHCAAATFFTVIIFYKRKPSFIALLLQHSRLHSHGAQKVTLRSMDHNILLLVIRFSSVKIKSILTWDICNDSATHCHTIPEWVTASPCWHFQRTGVLHRQSTFSYARCQHGTSNQNLHFAPQLLHTNYANNMQTSSGWNPWLSATLT